MKRRNRAATAVSRLPEYRAWSNMKQRCGNANHPDWDNYGGRGITVCERWKDSFENFLADMGPRPSSDHSLDRYPDNDGNYEPNNCRWATIAEQLSNTRRNVFHDFHGEILTTAQLAKRLGLGEFYVQTQLDKGIAPKDVGPSRVLKVTHDGLTLSLHRWAQRLGHSYASLKSRLEKGMTFEEAIKKPPKGPVTHNGQTFYLPEWARRFGIDYEVLRGRLKLGWTMEDALHTPTRRKEESRF